jgi:hypothetical protein
MRSKLFVCAALVGTCLFGTLSPAARAADPKAKAKKKSGDSLSDDKVISKQMQWEDSVMGPDDKRAELDKIARAQAINKAAAEKAAKEKDKADAQAAKEAAAPKAQTTKRGGDVALPTLPDEDSGKGSKGKSSEISPKLETAAAAAPPPPVKHGDDKFIDKLLTNEAGSKKKKTSAADDKALDDLLAVEKPKAAPVKGKGKKDDVDSLLLSADKAPPMPETHVKHETPEWAKPEIASTPVQAAPMPVRPQPKRDDGIIHVVQGAAPVGRPVVPARKTAVATPPPPVRASTVATRSPAGRRQAAPSDGNWNDPFTTSGPKKTVAARDTHSDDSGADDLDGLSATPHRKAAPPSRGGRGSGDDDANAKSTGGTRRTVPAAKPKWKDPFTESEAPAPSHPVHPVLATREPKAKRDAGESSKWDVAERHEASAASDAPRSGRWGVLKKRAH